MADSPGSPPFRARLGPLIVGTVAACFALYARAIAGGFVIDDRTFFIENDDLPRLGLSDAAAVFLRATNDWGDYQPIRDLLFLLQHLLFGRSPAGYHVVSIALYAATCVLAFALVRSLQSEPGGEPSRGDVAAVAVTSLFALHPTHVEAVAYICGQKELLSSLFSLGALLVFQRAFAEERRRAVRVIGGIALYGLAILSKQTAFMLAVLVPLLYLLSDPARRPGWARAALLWGAVNVPALLWMARSRAVFQALWGSTSAINSLPFADRIPLALKVVGAHAGLALWPHPLSFGYPFDATPRPDAHLAAGVLAIAGLAAVAVAFRRERAVVFGAVSFVILLVPVMQLHGSLNNASVYDRYLFLPVLGLAIVAERLLRAVWLERHGSRRGYAASLGALAVAGAALTVAYVPAFADDVAVTRNTYERFPGWSRPAFELAYSLVEAQRLDEARALVARERTLDSPAWVRPYFEGWILLSEGRHEAAVPVLERATFFAVAGGYFPFPSVRLGQALARAGRPADAERELRRVLASPIYQPLEVFHARKTLEEIATRSPPAAR